MIFECNPEIIMLGFHDFGLERFIEKMSKEASYRKPLFYYIQFENGETTSSSLKPMYIDELLS